MILRAILTLIMLVGLIVCLTSSVDGTALVVAAVSMSTLSLWYDQIVSYLGRKRDDPFCHWW